MLELRAITKCFGNFQAVQHVDLSIGEGEFFSLLGPSGCGKTTLLRMLAGFEQPTSGEIHFAGKRIDPLPPNERQFNLVFQRYALFPHLDVRENVEFGLRMKKLSESEIRSRVDEILALVKMESLAERDVTTLSGGQQQRVALARALVNRPRVLLLDEPLSALDLKLRQEMQFELRTLQRRLKHSFVFVTHDQEEALTLSDRVAVMDHGKIEQIGTPREIYESPATPFVARFIGTMNTLADGRMIRPEKLSLFASRPQGFEFVFEGVVRDRLYQGPMTQFVIEAQGASLVVTRPSEESLFEPGSRIYVAGRVEDCLEFPRP